jgi:hypothetical protein
VASRSSRRRIRRVISRSRWCVASRSRRRRPPRRAWTASPSGPRWPAPWPGTATTPPTTRRPTTAAATATASRPRRLAGTTACPCTTARGGTTAVASSSRTTRSSSRAARTPTPGAASCDGGNSLSLHGQTVTATEQQSQSVSGHPTMAITEREKKNNFSPVSPCSCSCLWVLVYYCTRALSCACEQLRCEASGI